MKTNDPIRAKKAWTRLIAAALAAVVLLAVSGFGIFKMLSEPKSLYPEWTESVEGSAETETAVAPQPGDYVEHEVYLILKNFAEGSRGSTVRERYGVVPINGELVAFCFPQRWLESEQAIVDATQDLLNGVEQYIDKYVVVRGTVKAMPEDVAAEFYSWFDENSEWLAESGLISASDDAAAVLSDNMVAVDKVGGMSEGCVVGLTAAAGLCLLYALYELIRLLTGGYADKQSVSEEETDGIEIEITETDPETGEDVTDVEVEITEEEPSEEAPVGEIIMEEAPVEEAVEEIVETAPVEEAVEEIVEAPVEEAVEEIVEAAPIEEPIEEVIEAAAEETPAGDADA